MYQPAQKESEKYFLDSFWEILNFVQNSGIILSVVFLFPALNPTGNASDEAIELKFALDIPNIPDSPHNRWAAAMHKQTNGKVKITFYWLGSLVRTKELLRATLKGLCDISFMSIGFFPSAYRLNSVMELPILNYPGPETATRIRDELLDRVPELMAEYKGTKLLWQQMGVFNTISTTKKPVRVPEDLKGMKIASFGATTKVVESLGGSPVTLMPMELFMALDRGIAEGNLGAFALLNLFRILKQLPFHNEIAINYTCQHTIMNQSKWNSLPPDIRNAFEELAPVMVKWVLEETLKLHKETLVLGKELNHTFIKNTKKENEAWQMKGKELHAKWIAENEAKGLPAQATYDELIGLINKHSN